MAVLTLIASFFCYQFLLFTDDMWMPFWICLQKEARLEGYQRALSARRRFFVDGGSHKLD